MEQQTPVMPQLCMKRDNLDNLPEIILPEGYFLRTSLSDDAPHWARIMNESFGGERTAQSFLDEMVDHPAYRPDRLFFICAPDGLPCATAGAYRDRGGFDDSVGYVHYVAVCAGHQGKKLGYWVSLAVLYKFREEGCTTAFLQTDDFRLPAIRTYLNLGFKPALVHENQQERWTEVYKKLELRNTMTKYIGNENVTLHQNCSWLPFDKNSWITKLNDGSLMTLHSIQSEDKDGNEIWTPCISTSLDGGNTWTEPAEVPLAPTTSPHWLAETAIIMQAKSGVIVMLYEDMANMVFEWDSDKKIPSDKTRLNVWACRSTDGGRTWNNFIQLVDGWCGALIDIKQLSNGRIVATVMDMIYSQGRHICFTCVSDDDGLTWQRGNHLDMGGRGHHDGAMEPTFIELKSGKLLMLIRTNLDVFWNAHSDDGKYWRIMEPSNIDASSSPGHLLRLASGRVALVWNRLYPKGQTEIERSEAGNDFAENATSWQRNELSIAFSSDECKTWTEPVVVARSTAGQIAYPYLLEYEPGDLWVITRAPVGGAINFRVDEKEFV